MCAILVVVGNVLGQQPFQVLFIEDNEIRPQEEAIMAKANLKGWAMLFLSLQPLALCNSSKIIAQDKPELNLQTSHLGRIHEVVFSPDGRTVASAAADHTIKIWDVSRRVLIRTLEGHSGEVRSLAFSRDGSLLVSGSQDHTIMLWDVQSGRSVRTIKEAPQFWVTGVRFSGDNQSIISVSRLSEEAMRSGKPDPTGWPILPEDIGDFEVWDLKTGKRIRSLRTNGLCEFLAATQDGSLVYCTTGEIWDTGSGKLVSNQFRLGRVVQGAFSPNGNLLAMVTSYGLDIWDVKRGDRIRQVRDQYVDGNERLEFTSVVFSPDGHLVATGDTHGWMGLWDAETGKGYPEVLGHSAEISSIAFSPDGKSLVTAASMDRTSAGAYSAIKIWKVDDDQLAAVGDFEGNSSSPLASAASSGAPQSDVTGHSVPISVISFSPDGRLLAAGGVDSIVRVWDLQSGSAHRLEGHAGEIRGLSFSPNSREIASSAKDSGDQATIRLWDARTGKLVGTLDAFTPYSVAFHPDGRDVVSDGMSSVTVWDTASNSKLEMYSTHSLHEGGFVAVSPSGKMIASASIVFKHSNEGNVIDRYTITIFDRETGKDLRVLSGHSQKINAGAFSGDGRTLVSGSNDGTLKVWDVNDGHVVRTLSGHSAPVRSVTYSSSGAMIASGSDDQSVKLWDAKTGRLLNTLAGHTGAVTSVSFGPEERTVAAGGSDGTIQIWSTKDGSLLLSLRVFEGRQWIAYSPLGYYTGSDGRADFITWRIGNTVYDANQFFEKFYTPDLFLRVFQGKAPAPVTESRGVAPPPDVLIVSPRPGQVLTEPEVEVSVQVKDLGGGVSEVRLFQNGKLVSPKNDRRDVTLGEASGASRTYKLTLLEGQNVLRVTAFSSDRTESKPHEVTVELRAPKKLAALRLLAVGISHYKNPGLSLTYPKADADGLVSFYKSTGSRLFREVDITELSDEAATEANIMQALSALRRRSLPEDVVIVFFAGHGASVNKPGETADMHQWYFIPYDLTTPESEPELSAHGVSKARLLEEVKAFPSQKMVLLVDACYAGSLISTFRGFEDRMALELLGRSTGVYIIAASARDQHASEVADLGHGVFTYALLKGLQGDAVLRTAERRVTVLGLISYIRDQLLEIGKKYSLEIQDPVTYSNGNDFPIALLP
jgi:WD40 repeat protein